MDGTGVDGKRDEDESDVGGMGCEDGTGADGKRDDG